MHNAASGVIEISDSWSIGDQDGLGNSLINDGLVRKTGAPSTTATFGLPFNNAGTVDVQSGSLRLIGSGTHTRNFQINNNATLELSNQVFQNSSSILGAGKISFVAVSSTVSGIYNISGLTSITTTVNFNTAAETQDLDLAGTLVANAPFTVHGALNWIATNPFQSYPKISGNSTFTAAGTTTMVGIAAKVIDDVLFENTGTIIASAAGTGPIVLTNGAQLHNAASGVIEISDSWSIGDQDGLGNSLINDGLVRKTGPAGSTASIALPFNNAGIVDVQTGTMRIIGQGTYTTGSIQVASGASLELAGSANTFQASSSIEGAGTIYFGPYSTNTINGVYDVSGLTSIVGTVNFNTAVEAQDLDFAGTALVVNAPFTVYGTFNWENASPFTTAPKLSGSSTFTAAGTTNLLGIGLKTIDNVLFENTGTIIASAAGAGAIHLTNGAQLHNTASGTIEISSWSISDQDGLGNSLINDGLVRKTGPTGSTGHIGLPFNNVGIVEVQSGTLQIVGQGTHTGSFQVASGARLDLYGDAKTFQAGSSIGGAGTVYFAPYGTITINGVYEVSGLTSIAGGTVNFNTAVEAQDLDFGGTTLAVNAPFTVYGTFNWENANPFTTAPKLSGSSTFTAAGTTNLLGIGQKTIDNVLFENTGTIIASAAGAGAIHLTNGAQLHNTASGTIEISSWSISDQDGLGNSLINDGLVRKTGSGDASLSIPFQNAGTVHVQAGALRFQSEYTDNSGMIIVDEGASFISASPITIQGGTIQGSGTLVANIINGGTVAPGSSPGTLTINGSYIQEPTGTLRLSISGTEADQFDVLVVTGATVFDGALHLVFEDGFAPNLGDTFSLFDGLPALGQFNSILVEGLAPEWEYSLDPTLLRLTSLTDGVSELTGDYNGNGVVDAADYTVWRDSRGRAGAGLAADGNGNGTVDAGDYDIWTAGFGSVAGSGTQLVPTVPEPTSLVLLALALVPAWACGRPHSDFARTSTVK